MVNYANNYKNLVEAAQRGGTEMAESFKRSRDSRVRSLGVPEQTVSDADIDDLSKKLLARFTEIREENESSKERMKELIQQLEEEDIEIDPLTDEIEPPTEDPDVQTSGDVASFVAGFEGFRNKPYWDINKWTYGYGSTAPNETATITEAEAKKLLQKDLLEARATVLKFRDKYGYDWSDNQIDALTSFTQNLGQGNLETLLTGDEEGARSDEEISEMILEYNRAGGKVLAGLTKRRQAEANLFTQGYN